MVFQQAEVTEVVMESTAQYWRPVWSELEPHFTLHLAHAQSNRAPKGRKSDWADAKRLVKRFAAEELFWSFVPEPEQRDWRMLTRARYALIRDHVHLQNQIEALLEQASIKLSSVVSDLFGVSGLRILWALSQGQTDPAKLADLADGHLRCGREVLVDALRGHFGEVHRHLLEQALQRLRMLSEQVAALHQLAAKRMQPHASTVPRLIEVPGVGAEAAQAIVAEIGPTAAAFPSSGSIGFLDGSLPGNPGIGGSELFRPLRQRQPLYSQRALPSGSRRRAHQGQSPPDGFSEIPGQAGLLQQSDLGGGSQDLQDYLAYPA